MTSNNEKSYRIKLGNPILTVDDVNLDRGGTRLLHGIKAKIRHGSITLVLGHNGAGKTLLMYVLHGLVDFDSGNVSGPPPDRQKMVFQKPVMLRRTARQHLTFLCPKVPWDELYQWVKRAGLESCIDLPARALSGGEQQKLSLIGALAANPEILFLDEPTSHLDFESTKFLEEMITEAHSRDMTIVMTSHNLAQAQRLAEDILLLHEGQLVEDAPADQFFNAPSNPLAKQYLNHL